MNNDNIHENSNISDHDYKVGDKIMPNNHAAYRYEITYKGPFVITQCWTSGTVTLKYGATKIRHNIRRIKPYTSDTNVEDIKAETND